MRTIRGFTLIEMVIVMVITSIVVIIAASIFRSGFSNYFTLVDVTALNNQISNSMTRISLELAQASSFSAASATSMTFKTTTGSTITYSWASPTITRTGTSAQTLSDKTTSFALNYYQANYSATTTLTLIRAVTISMTITNGTETISLVNTVFLNNMS